MQAQTLLIIRQAALTLAIGGVGGATFWQFGMPAPFLTGSATAVTLAGLFNLPVLIPARLRDFSFLLIGIGIGASVTSDVLRAAVTWPVSLAMLGLSLVTIMFVCRFVLEHGFGFDRKSAMLASAPGHLSFVLGMAAEGGIDVGRVALVQSIRVLFLTLIVPSLVLAGFEKSHDLRPDVGVMGLGVIGFALILAFIVGLGFKRLQLPAAFLLAGMAVSALLHLSDTVTGNMPGWLANLAFVVMGGLIGTRFRGQSRAALRANALAGITVTLIGATIAVAAAFLTLLWLDMPGALLVVAFAPGGVEAMAAIAVEMGVDPTFVAAHHVLRLLMLTFLVPMFYVSRP